MINDLKIIKKKYGEEMLHLCKSWLPNIFNDNLSDRMLKLFAPNHSLARDIKKEHKENEFKCLILDENKEIRELSANKTPEELFSDIGYKLFECISKEEVEHIKKNYFNKEDSRYLSNSLMASSSVFFAVKENALEIQRPYFEYYPKRDQYSESVKIIHFSKNYNRYIIYNRYCMKNLNANPDNIVIGLTESFSRHKNLKSSFIKNDFKLDSYVEDETGKYYKYNYKIDNVYYCTDNVIIINGKARKLPNWVMLIDYFMIDVKHKKILSYIDDQIFHNFTDIKEIIITKENGNKLITIIHKNQEETKILVNKENQIIGFESTYIIDTKNNFLANCKYIKYFSLPKAKMIGNYIMSSNKECENVYIPLCEEIGDNFFAFNNKIKSITLPKVKRIGFGFFIDNKICTEVIAPECTIIGNCFFYLNENIKRVIFLKLKKISYFAFHHNKVCKEFIAPVCEEIGDGVLEAASLDVIDIPDYCKIEDSAFKRILERK